MLDEMGRLGDCERFVVDPVIAVRCPDERPHVDRKQRAVETGEVAVEGAVDHRHFDAALPVLNSRVQIEKLGAAPLNKSRASTPDPKRFRANISVSDKHRTHKKRARGTNDRFQGVFRIDGIVTHAALL